MVCNLLCFVDMLLIGYFLGFVVMLFNNCFKWIGDWVVGIMVIYEDELEVWLELLKG